MTRQPMTIPARFLIRYIETSHSWPLRDEVGKPAGQIDRERFGWLIRTETAVGVGSKTGLKYVQLLKPVEEVQRAVQKALEAAREEAMQREREQCFRIPNALPCVVKEHVGVHYAFKHVAHRCSAAAPGRIPVSGAWM